MSNIQQKHLELINQFNNIIDLIKGADTEEKIKMLKELPKLDADEMMNEFEELEEELKEEYKEEFEEEQEEYISSVISNAGFDEEIFDEDNFEFEEWIVDIKEKFDKNIEDMLNKQMDETSNKIKYIETSKIQKNKKNVVYICNNEDEEDYKDEERKPISIFWNHKDKLINHFMEGHYNNYSIYDFDFFLDFGFMDIVKKIFKWNYGQRIYFYTKTNADGYFNIWRETGDVGLNYCINENGYIETTIYNMTLSKNTSLVFDCNYNRKQKKLNDEKNYIDIL